MKPTKQQRYLLERLVAKHGGASIGWSRSMAQAWLQDGLLPVEALLQRTVEVMEQRGWIEPYTSPWKPWYADAVNYQITDAGKAVLG